MGADGLDVYRLLQNLASPIVAITSAADGVRNGMIANSAVRASIAPLHPRLAFFAHKFNFSHDLIHRGGAFALHLLRDDQWELIHRLGFASGRDGDKLADVPITTAETGCPILADCYAAFDCRVAAAMDAGASTLFLGDVTRAVRGTGERIMTAAYFRMHLRPDWRAEYEANLRKAQAYADAHGTIGGAEGVPVETGGRERTADPKNRY